MKAIEAAVIFLFPANPLIAITLNPCSGILQINHNNKKSFQLEKCEKDSTDEIKSIGILYISKVQKKQQKSISDSWKIY